MEATKILEVINSVNMNDAERNTFDVLTDWMKEHPVEPTTFEPAAALAYLTHLAEQELREEAVASKLGAGAVMAAKIVNKRMNSERQSELWRHAYMGELNGEMYQIASLEGFAIVALRERNDLIDTGNDEATRDKLVNLFIRNARGTYRDLVFDPADIEAAYKLSRTRGVKTSPKNPKRYPAIRINGKGYDADLIRDVLRIMGTDKLVWSQHESPLAVDCLETSRGYALICPVKLVEDSPLTPIEVKSEIGTHPAIYIY